MTARSHCVALHPAPILSVALGLDGVERTGQPAQGEDGKEGSLPKTSLLEQVTPEASPSSQMPYLKLDGCWTHGHEPRPVPPGHRLQHQVLPG